MRLRAIAISLASLASPALAGEISLAPPVACEVGEDKRCYIQHFMDIDPAQNAQDFLCGTTTYDGHKGTDFAVRSLAEMNAGVEILAAAPGVVMGVRDGMPDKEFNPETDDLDGRDCGNGLVLRHSGGWETQYCHLRNGSVQVQRGDTVRPGDVLGLIGMSGRASFPHLHLSLRKDGVHVDPFAPDATKACGTDQTPLWADPPEVQATGLIATGFAQGIPSYDRIKAGTAHIQNMTTDSPALVIWGFAFASQPGDVMRLSINGPDGDLVYTKDVTLERAQAQYFRAVGRKTQDADWFTPGAYTGTVALLRNGTVVSDQTTNVTVTQ